MNKYQLLEALKNLSASRMRTLLAILGILIGTASVVAMVTTGQMATQKALAEFKILGTNLMSVTVFQTAEQPTSIKKSLELEDFGSLKQTLPAIESISPYTDLFLPITYRSQKMEGSVIGVRENIQNILKIKLATGRFISDLDHYENFCVIGTDIDEQLKKRGILNPIGKQIEISNRVFTIVGVLQHWQDNSFFNQSIDNSILIPIQASFLLNQRGTINDFVMSIQKDTDIKALEKQIQAILTTEIPKLNIYIRSAEQIISSMKNQSKIYTLLLGLIGSISLLVGGIGVMNIMLVSVTERRKEIGIRMAVGATRRDIQTLFLTEAIFLSLFGGILGILTGLLISLLIASFTQWEFQFFLLPPLIGFLVSTATGVFFGFYPARLAARVDPIQALRSDV